jgi:hypothetical protein
MRSNEGVWRDFKPINRSVGAFLIGLSVCFAGIGGFLREFAWTGPVPRNIVPIGEILPGKRNKCGNIAMNTMKYMLYNGFI